MSEYEYDQMIDEVNDNNRPMPFKVLEQQLANFLSRYPKGNSLQFKQYLTVLASISKL